MPESTSQSHPSAESLRRFGSGEVHGRDADLIAEHVETCDACCRKLRHLSPDPLLGRLQAAVEEGGQQPTWLETAPASAGKRDELGSPSQLCITLTVTAGPHKGRSFTFADHDTFIVGRSQRAHFRLASKDRYFSRFHFVVEVNPPRCRLLDMNSRNGTFVNGERVVSADLNDGDRIKAGHTFLQVALVGGEVAEPPPRGAGGPPAQIRQATVVEEPAVLEPPAAARSEPVGRAPAEPTPAVPAAATVQPCRVCAAPGLPALAPAVPWPLCSACLEQVRLQPQTIPGYLLVRLLGQGGMGMVYLALREGDGSLVAVKTVIPATAGSRSDIDRFLREARILGELHHHNIVAYHDMGEANGRLYFVMEYVPGSDAKRLLRANGPFPMERAVRLCCQVLEALEYAHDRGFVHRDIKPANILVGTFGADGAGADLAKLADFGLARVYETSKLSGLTLQGHIGGTFDFIAPEQITNFRAARPASDQYAAAATLYNLLTDRCIFDLPDQLQAKMMMILEEKPVPIRTRRADVPQALAAVIEKALAKEPAKRFRDVRSLRRELMQFWC